MASENRALKRTINGHLNQTAVHYELLCDVFLLVRSKIFSHYDAFIYGASPMGWFS